MKVTRPNRKAVLIFSGAVLLVIALLWALIYFVFWQPSTLHGNGLGSAAPRSQNITLYFLDGNEAKMISRSFRLPEHLTFPEQIRSIVEKMTEKPKPEESSLWPAALRFRNVFLRKNGLLILDLDQGVTYNHFSSTLGEVRILQSLIYTVLNNYPNIQRVKFLINGSEQETFNGHVDISRSFGLKDLQP